jgi:outer membrane lipoprotein carrier protein
VSALLAATAAVWLAGGAAASPDPAQALARRIEEKQRSARDLTARFVQTYRSGILGREVVEAGRVSIKPPGRMLWEYREPEKKVFVSDGKTCYFYVPADRQVIVRDSAGERGLPAQLLSGRSDLLSEFEVALEAAPAGRQRLRLVPREPDPEIERVYLEIDAEAHIRQLDILDVQGNWSQFRFDEIREDVGLPDRLFHFDIPPGVEVVAG